MPSTSPPAPARLDTESAPVPGLRERNKAKRRALIQRTAARLFAERGFEQTTLAEIAAEAEVAVGTISSYFPSKLALATSFADDIATRLSQALVADPRADVIAVFDVWLAEEERILDPEMLALVHAMDEANPSLFGVQSAHIAKAVELGRSALIAHLGRPEEDPLVSLCFAALGATINVHFGSLATRGASPELHDTVIGYLRAIVDAARL